MRFCRGFQPVLLRHEGRKNGICRLLVTQSPQPACTSKVADYRYKPSTEYVCGEVVIENQIPFYAAIPRTDNSDKKEIRCAVIRGRVTGTKTPYLRTYLYSPTFLPSSSNVFDNIFPSPRFSNNTKQILLSEYIL